MTNRVASWRQQLGASTALWAGAGRHEVNDQRWLTLSGSPSIDYNVVLCYGDGLGDWGSLLSESLADVKAATVPSVVMVTGAALGSVQVLIDAKWVCIGEVPLMHLPATAVSPDPNDVAIRKLGEEDLAASRDVVARAFGSPPSVADLGIPDATVEPGPFSLWGVEIDGRLVSVAAAVRVGSSAAFWSVATPPDEQGRGYGQRLFASLHPRLKAEGVEDFLLYASGPGQALYRRLGYHVVEHWQQWSYPRWVFGRA